MIRYRLICDSEHEFEAWFRSSSDYEAQAGRQLVSCPTCGSVKVERGLMAPNVVTARGKAVAVPETAPEPVAAAPVQPALPQMAMLPDPVQKAMLEAMAEIRRQVAANADYVGDKFSEEARKMHYGESEKRGIYGEATLEDARSLVDEGIEVHALPVLPEDRN